MPYNVPIWLESTESRQKNLNGLQFILFYFIFWLGQIWVQAAKQGPQVEFGFGLASQVRVCKNPVRCRSYSQHHSPRLWKMNFYFYTHDGSPRHTRKTHQEESLICVYNYHPSHRQKKSQKWREFAFSVHCATSSLNDQSPAACPQHSSHERCGSHPETSSQYGQCAHFPPDLFFDQDHENDLDVKTPQILPSGDLNLPQLDVKLTTTP